MYNNKYQEGHRNALPFNLISIVCYIGDSMIIIRSRMLPHTTACANCRNIKNSARDMTKKRRNWNNTGKNARIRHLTCFQNGFAACGVRGWLSRLEAAIKWRCMLQEILTGISGRLETSALLWVQSGTML